MSSDINRLLLIDNMATVQLSIGIIDPNYYRDNTISNLRYYK